jgi:hypothetical protein
VSATDPTATDNDIDVWSKSDLSTLIAPNPTNNYDEDDDDDLFFSNPDKISDAQDGFTLTHLLLLTHSLTYSLTYLLTYSLTHSLTHL